MGDDEAQVTTNKAASYVAIGAALRAAIHASGLRKQVIAERISVHPGTLSRWLGGEALPTAAAWRALLGVLDAAGADVTACRSAMGGALDVARREYDSPPPGTDLPV